MNTYEAEVTCNVFTRVWVRANSEDEARAKISKGGGYWDSAEFEKHTADSVTIESVVNLDADDGNEDDEDEEDNE